MDKKMTEKTVPDEEEVARAIWEVCCDPSDGYTPDDYLPAARAAMRVLALYPRSIPDTSEIERLQQELKNAVERIAELLVLNTLSFAPEGWQLVPIEITPAIACALEGCGGPEKQSAESLKFLVESYEQQWANVLATAGINWRER